MVPMEYAIAIPLSNVVIILQGWDICYNYYDDIQYYLDSYVELTATRYKCYLNLEAINLIRYSYHVSKDSNREFQYLAV